MVGLGLTVMVYPEGFPVHPFKVAETDIVPDIAVEPVLVATKEGTFPVPLAASPIPVLLLVQLKVEPAGVLVKVDAAIVEPAQTVTLAGTVAVGLGLTVIV